MSGPSSRTLVVHPRGGLANRLRVVASAEITAAAGARALALDWSIGSECGACWDELFENEIASWTGPLPAGALRYEGQLARFEVPGPGDAAAEPAAVAWVRTCFEFKPRAMSAAEFAAAKAAFYGRLLPVRSVRERLEALGRELDGRPVVGVHVRRGDLVLVGDAPQAVSPTAAFLRRMRRLVDERPATAFFLATDDEDEEAAIRAAFPGRVITQSRPERRRDAVEGVRHALVDWLALARTSLLLRSAGTSFSREAAIAGGVPRETIVRPLWPYRRPRFWVEAWQRRLARLRRRLGARGGGR